MEKDILKYYKYRIYPTPKQSVKINKTLGVCRFVYNLALETKIWAYKSAGISLSVYDLQKQFTQLRKDYEWIREVGYESPGEAILNIDKAFKSFFSGGGFPNFKSKKDRMAFCVKGNSRIVDFDNHSITAGFIKNIPAKLSRKFTGSIRRIYISKTQTGKFFASILVQTNDLKIKPNLVSASNTIGIDVGINNLVVTSNGEKFQPNRRLKNNLKRLQCLQRRASRKKKGSNNRKKSNKCVAILHEKITNQRTDYIHKVTSSLVKGDNQTFVIEDLNVAGMLKNRRLAQSLSDVSFGEFFRQMKYKCEWYGKNLITIGRFEPTSKKCSSCGEINKELTLGNREWVCPCGISHDRDINAAINIRKSGLEKSGEPAELPTIVGAMKQEYVINFKKGTTG